MNDQERLGAFLGAQEYMTIAVTLDDGAPWATPVRIRAREGKTFEWDSHVATEHSKAIANRPDVAISIYAPAGDQTEQFGFYAHALAEQVGEPNEHGIARYRATVSKSFINDATFEKREVELG
jgi:hypothetical protein